MRNRLWKCVEVSVGCRRKRRRGVCAALYPVPAYFRTSCNDNGICFGQGVTGKSCKDVSEAGKEGAEVAFSWVCGAFWKCVPDGVLYGGDGMADLLFCKLRHRKNTGAWF